jgi:hypothetical protein
MRGAIPPLHQYVFMTFYVKRSTGTTLLLPLTLHFFSSTQNLWLILFGYVNTAQQSFSYSPKTGKYSALVLIVFCSCRPHFVLGCVSWNLWGQEFRPKVGEYDRRLNVCRDCKTINRKQNWKCAMYICSIDFWLVTRVIKAWDLYHEMFVYKYLR